MSTNFKNSVGNKYIIFLSFSPARRARRAGCTCVIIKTPEGELVKLGFNIKNVLSSILVGLIFSSNWF